MHTALVTGGARGIGLAIAQRLLRDGYAVAVADVNATALGRLDALAAQHAERFHRLLLDITDYAQVEAGVRDIITRWGRLDVLVNNAGRNSGGGTFETGEQEWDWVMETNLKGAFFCTKAAATPMRAQGGGAVINISSTAASGQGGNPAYSASKAGIIGLMRAQAVELGPFGIRINAVAPGVTMTQWVERHVPAAALAEEARLSPLRRAGDPEDIAACVAFLVSEAARHITGQTISVSGGRWMP